MQGASYRECLGTAWLGALLAQLLGLIAVLRAGCGTMSTLHTMLWDHLSSWFLQVGLIPPEAGRKQAGYSQQDWGQQWPQRHNSWEVSGVPSPQCLCVGHRDDQPSSTRPVCPEPFCTQLKATEWGCFNLSVQCLKAVTFSSAHRSDFFLLPFPKSSTNRPKQLLTVPLLLSIVIRNTESHSAALFHS